MEDGTVLDQEAMKKLSKDDLVKYALKVSNLNQWGYIMGIYKFGHMCLLLNTIN